MFLISVFFQIINCPLDGAFLLRLRLLLLGLLRLLLLLLLLLCHEQRCLVLPEVGSINRSRQAAYEQYCQHHFHVGSPKFLAKG